MRTDAPADLQRSDVIKDIIASKLKCCVFCFFLLMGVDVVSASLISGDSKCSHVIWKKNISSIVRNKHK